MLGVAEIHKNVIQESHSECHKCATGTGNQDQGKYQQYRDNVLAVLATQEMVTMIGKRIEKKWIIVVLILRRSTKA